MKLFRTLLGCSLMMLMTVAAFAQEGEAKLMDEVIARVNSSMIMRSDFEKAQRDYLEEMKQAGLSPEEIEKKLAEFRPRILDTLIDQQLLIQRAKDLSLEKNCEVMVNQQLVRIMKENNIQTVEELEQKMREVGVDINEVRRNIRNGCLSEEVRRQEVYGQIYRLLTDSDKREYFDKHKELFVVPGEITLSRILIKAGKDADKDLTRAKDIVTQAKAGGADFCALVRRYSEEDLAKSCGKMESIKMDLLLNEVKAVVASAEVGAITEPIKVQDGFVIFRVDARKEPKARTYDEEEVKQEVVNRLVYEKAQTEIETYMVKLRDDAFIEIDARYQLQGMKVQSASIKRVPFSEETPKERKKREKQEKKDRERQEKQKKDAANTTAKVQ